MNDSWICAAGGKRIGVRCLTVVTAHEVRQFAARKLGADPASIDVKRAPEDGIPAGATVFEVQWVGNDFSHGGTTHGRRMQERAMGGEEWVNA